MADEGSDGDGRQRVINSAEREGIVETLTAVRDGILKKSGGVRNGTTEKLDLIVESGFRAETRAWALEYTAEIDARYGRALRSLEAGQLHITDSSDWPALAEMVAEATGPLSYWLNDPSELLASTATDAVQSALALSQRVDRARTSVAKGLTEVAGLNYLAELKNQYESERDAARLWIIATAVLVLSAIASALLAIGAIEIDLLDYAEARSGDRLALLAPTIAFAAAAAWTGRNFGVRSMARDRYRERLVRLRTLDAVATSTELASAGNTRYGRNEELEIRREILIRASADPIDLSATGSGPSVGDAILDLIRDRRSDPAR